MIILFFNGCSKLSPVERIEEVEPFTEVLLDSPFDVYLTEGTEYTIRVVADESIIDHITCEVNDSLLTISNGKKYRWLTPEKNKVKIYVTSPPLKTVMANETCFVKTLTPITSEEFGMVFLNKANNAELDLNCNVFYYWNNYPCGGTLTLHGNCNWLKVWNVAIADVQAEDLDAKQAQISNNSKGDCVIKVSDYLKYTIPGEGNIEVYGAPADIEEYAVSSGSGELILH
ncbi:DUF2807 domain-containing protein [Parvicella tangerina]|nr:DUF2807 domain-containing protein [Parvicella tangerina]